MLVWNNCLLLWGKGERKMNSGLISALADLSDRQSFVKPRAPPIDQPVRKKARGREREWEGLLPSSTSPYKEKNTCEVLITSKTTTPSNPTYEPPPTLLTTPTGSVLGFHLSRSLDLHWTRIPCHLVLRSARLPPCALGTCLKNSIFGSALKDCISPEGQLLADSSAKNIVV